MMSAASIRQMATAAPLVITVQEPVTDDVYVVTLIKAEFRAKWWQMPLVYLCHWLGIPVSPESELDTAYDSLGAAHAAIKFQRNRDGANKHDKWQAHHFRKNKLGVYERIYHADDSEEFDTSGYEVVSVEMLNDILRRLEKMAQSDD